MSAIRSWLILGLGWMSFAVCADEPGSFLSGSHHAGSHASGPHSPGSHSLGSHPPGAMVPQPWAPSTLPETPHRFHGRPPHRIDGGIFDDGAIDRVVVEYGIESDDHRMTHCRPSNVAPGDAGEDGQTTPKPAIDWCAVPAFEPRYAPQWPAAWWWRHGPSWRYRRTR